MLDLAPGRWVADHPDRPIHGDPIGQPVSSRVDPADILTDYRIARFPGRFYRLEVGGPWADVERRLDMDSVLSLGPCSIARSVGARLHPATLASMPSVGEKLRTEREARGTTIEDLSLATGIYLGYLEALERDEFHALPGRAFGKLYIRAYAKILGFDPQPLINEYDRELAARRQSSLEPAPPGPVRPRRAEAVITRWRQTARAERGKQYGRAALARTDTGEPAAPPRDAPIEIRDDEALGVREEAAAEAPRPEPVEPWRDETRAIEPEEPAEVGEAGSVEVAGAVPPSQQEPVAAWRDEPHPIERATFSAPDGAAPVASISGAGERGVRPAFLPSRPWVVGLISFGLLVVAAGILFTLRRNAAEGSEPAPAAAIAPANTGVAPPPSPPMRTPHTDPPVSPAAPAPAPRPAGTTSRAASHPEQLTVPEFGVGRRVVRRRLEGRADRFAPWDVAWFSTRVLGGGPGDVVRHVWLHEGRTMQTIELRLGGPDWHTHSRKTIGHPGEWAVEARDETDRVLARTTFTCAPAER